MVAQRYQFSKRKGEKKMAYSAELEMWAEQNTPSDGILQFAQQIDLASTLDDAAANPAVMQIMESILNAADDEDSIFAAANAGTLSSKEWKNHPFRLQEVDIQYKRSAVTYREQGGFPWYSLLQVTDLEDGVLKPVTCGGYSAVTTIWKLQLSGVLAKYKDEGGMPLQFVGKQTSRFEVILVQPFRMMDSKKSFRAEKA